MKIVSTFHPPSSVVSSVKCQLGSRGTEHLVIAKLDRIDVYSLQPSGLRHECGVDVWGKVLCVRAIPISNTGRSTLALMTSHPDPELVFFSYRESESGGAELSVEQSLSLYERSPREAEFFNDLVVHPSGELAIVSCYVGRLKVINLKGGNYVDSFDFSLLELNVLAATFLSNEEYVLAILHKDNQSRVQLLAREIPSGPEADVSITPSTVLQPTIISDKIIPTPDDTSVRLMAVPPATVGNRDNNEDDEPEFLGGVLVIGGRSLLLYGLASETERERQRGKAERLEKKKKATDPAEAKKARDKELHREGKKRKPTATMEWPWDEVSASCSVGDTGSPFRLFVGDSYGTLSMLSIETTEDGVNMLLVPMGRSSPPTTLSYLANQTLFIGSHLGDSQIVHILPEPSGTTDPVTPIPSTIPTVKRNDLDSTSTRKGKARQVDPDDMEVDDDEEPEEEITKRGRIVEPEGSYLRVVDSFKNVAPIHDAILVDVDRSGQNEIVTCSGGFSNGTLNVIRNGADFIEGATVPGIYDINAVWTVRPNFEAKTHSHMAVSTHDKTLLFQINDNGSNTTLAYLDSTSSRDFITLEPTVAVANVRKRGLVNKKSVYQDSNWIVQVVTSQVRLLQHDPVLGGFNILAQWSPPTSLDPSWTEIVSASINPSQIALGLGGRKLVVLRFNETGTAFELVAEKYLPAEISAVSCVPPDPTASYTRFVTVGFWESLTEPDHPSSDTAIEVFCLEKSNSGGLQLSTVSKIPRKQVPALPRSLILHEFGPVSGNASRPAYLLCGLADGTVVHFSWKDGHLRDDKHVTLGRTPVELTPCEVDGKLCVFAVGNRAALFSFDRKRLLHSPVMLKSARSVCSLNTTTFKSSFVLATEEGLSIGTVKDLGKVNIRSIPFGRYCPEKIVHIPLAGAFAVACTAFETARVGSAVSFKNALKLIDDASFEDLYQFDSDSDEIITALVSFNLQVEDKEVPFIVAGTTGEEKGRILLFSVATAEAEQANRILTLVSSLDVNGQKVPSLLYVDGHVIAAVDSAVVSYSAKTQGTWVPVELEQVSEWNHNYMVQSLGCINRRVVIGDMASSVSMVEVNKGKLTPVGRDYAPLKPFALEALSEDSLIGGNDASNLFTFSLGEKGGRRVLERDGSYFLGDLATKFIRGTISSDFTSDAFEPEALFVTSCGKIGVIIDVKDQGLAVHLSALQRNLANQVKGIGAASHSSFRAPRNKRSWTDAEASAFGFVDGDFVETFIGLISDKEAVAKVVQGGSEPERLSLPIEDYHRLLEELQNLH